VLCYIITAKSYSIWLKQKGELKMKKKYSGEEILRQKFGTKGITVHKNIPPFFREFMESMDYFFIATANQEGKCDCSFRGGYPLVKVIDKSSLIFPDYPGNGAFQSLGNIVENPHVGLLFLDFENAIRIRVNGRAEILHDHDMLNDFPGSIQIVKVELEEIFGNCPGNIPLMKRKG
jgi:predicted pyridoxine 5'-phosphate oxidase superfamily flavin-nucleotide-binding protein